MNKTHHRAAGIAMAGLLTAHAGPAVSSVVPALRPLCGVRDRLEDRRVVALTFDDGPDRHGTPVILETLREHAVTATFFLCGEQVRAAPALADEIVAAGHEVAVHGDRHRNVLRVSPSALRRDLDDAEATIIDATGRPPRLYRPPYGVLSGAALALARGHDWTTVLWTRWGRDWRRAATPASIADEVTRDLRGGEVLLLHDADRYSAPGSWRATAAALPAVIERVRQAGLDFGGVQATVM